MAINQIIALTCLAGCFTYVTVSSDPKPVDYENFCKVFFDNFNAHDWEALSEMYAETAEFKDPSLGTGVYMKTREDFVKKYTELSSMIPDVQDSVVAIYPSGKSVIVEFISTGTAPDGTKFTLPLCAILTIENGLITKDYIYYDNF